MLSALEENVIPTSEVRISVVILSQTLGKQFLYSTSGLGKYNHTTPFFGVRNVPDSYYTIPLLVDFSTAKPARYPGLAAHSPQHVVPVRSLQEVGEILRETPNDQ